MKTMKASALALLLCFPEALTAQSAAEWTARRNELAKAAPNGILLLRAAARVKLQDSSFRQTPLFYYATGMSDVAGAMLAIDGHSGESWLFLPEGASLGMQSPQLKKEHWSDIHGATGVQHVAGWSELADFLRGRLTGVGAATLFYANEAWTTDYFPPHFGDATADSLPLWLHDIHHQFPQTKLEDVTRRVQSLLVQKRESEIAFMRASGRSSREALLAGLKAVVPGVWQRKAEYQIAHACWLAGSDGVSFWPWAMSGPNAVFPTPFASLTSYRDLDRQMQKGELVRIDVGCENDHYRGDVGRTAPVSGHFTPAQRETWNAFIAAYQAGLKAMRAGMASRQVFAIWRMELSCRRDLMTTDFAKRALQAWAQPDGAAYSEIHGIGLVETPTPDVLEEGMTLAFEPIASFEGEGYYLEDMILIHKDGAEVLTPNLPYTADEIEAAMASR